VLFPGGGGEHQLTARRRRLDDGAHGRQVLLAQQQIRFVHDDAAQVLRLQLAPGDQLSDATR
jgi:hypothetical protein